MNTACTDEKLSVQTSTRARAGCPSATSGASARVRGVPCPRDPVPACYPALKLVPVPGHGAQICARAPCPGNKSERGQCLLVCKMQHRAWPREENFNPKTFADLNRSDEMWEQKLGTWTAVLVIRAARLYSLFDFICCQMGSINFKQEDEIYIKASKEL